MEEKVTRGARFLNILVAISVLLMLSFPMEVYSDEIEIFPALPQDGYIESTSSIAEKGDVYDSDPYNWLSIGQDQNDYPIRDYFWRSYLFFNTSTIGDREITSARLWLFKMLHYGATTWDVAITNGQPTYPHFPLNETDFNEELYSGIGGKGTFPEEDDEFFSIPFNQTGMSWINPSGITKLGLFAEWDITGSPVYMGDVCVFLNSSEVENDATPYLELTLKKKGVGAGGSPPRPPWYHVPVLRLREFLKQKIGSPLWMMWFEYKITLEGIVASGAVFVAGVVGLRVLRVFHKPKKRKLRVKNVEVVY